MCNNFFSHFHQFFFHFFNLLLLSLCIQCNYDPDDEYFSRIEPPSKPNAQITINDQDSLITVWQVTDCYYNFSSLENLSIYEVNVYLDDELIITSPTTSIHFTINPESFSAGIHKIKITTLTNSGSGSLIDRVGGEGFIYSKEWDLIIENYRPDSHYITEMINENGVLKISWQKYNRINFLKYELYRLPTTHKSEYYHHELVTTIPDSTKNYFFDSTYVGGPRTYFVNVSAGSHTVSGITDNVNYPLPKVLSSESQGFSLNLTFSKCLFPHAFKEYGFYINHDEEYYEDTEKGVITELEDTQITLDDLFFGSGFKLKLITYPLNIEYDIFDKKYKPTTTVYVHIGDTSFAFNPGRAMLAGQSLYFGKHYDGSFYRYSTTNNSISKIIQNDLDIYGQGGMHISFDEKYFLYSDVINSVSRLFTLPEMIEIASNESIFSGSGRISNNGIIPVIANKELMIFDCIQNKYIDTINTNYTDPGGYYHLSGAHISPEGDFLYASSILLGDTLFHKTASNDYISIYAPPLSETFLEYNPLNNDELIYYNQNSLTLFNYKTQSIVKKYTHIQAPFSNIDPVTGHFLALDNIEERRFGIYNIFDGSKVGSVRLAYNVSVEGLILYNDVIYSSYGYKMEITP